MSNETAVSRDWTATLQSADPDLRALAQYHVYGTVPSDYALVTGPDGAVTVQKKLSLLDHLKAASPALIGAGAAFAAPALAGLLGVGGSSPAAVSNLPVTAGASGAGTSAGTGGALASSGVSVPMLTPAAVATGGGMAFGLKDAAQLAPLVASLFHSGSVSSTPPQNAALQNLINLQTQRLQESDPLYQAIVRMASGLLPTMYQPTTQSTATIPSAGTASGRR